MNAPNEELLVVVGPTASGKTELSVRLAERDHGEIISADSVQVYRHFEIGTGKPSADELARARHHLIDVVEPHEPMDAARFAELARGVIADVRARGRRPIVCGGTYLWVRALVYGLAPAPPADPELRRRYEDWAAREGRGALHAELQKRDPEAAARLAPNDFVRVSRALEVFELTGLPLSRWQAEHGFRTAHYQARLVGVHRAKEELDERIAARVRAMFAAGWLDEVRDLLARGYADARAMSAVGYKQVAAAVQSPSGFDQAELELQIVRATRIFARRQRTWLRDEPVRWLDAGARERLDC